jgi:hypothetical protein
LIDYFHKVFNDELEGAGPHHTYHSVLDIQAANVPEGKTYPQEGPLDYDAFAGYFFGAATIVGIVSEGEAKKTLEEAVAGQKLEEVAGGCYYM